MNKIFQTLPVSRMDEASKAYLVEYDDKVYRVHMVSEQVGRECPASIDCIIESGQGRTVITQNLKKLLEKHYAVGDEVMYRIVSVTSRGYYLKDDYGYTSYLASRYKINPTITPKLKCRVRAITEKRTLLELVEKISVEQSQFTIGQEKVRQLFEPRIDCAAEITRLLLSDEVIGSFDSECHRWIYALYQQQHTQTAYFKNIREVCLEIMEESTLLYECKCNEREVLEERFTTLIEQLANFISALELVAKGKEKETIEELLHKLQRTGSVFHPRKKFYIMMCIFLVKAGNQTGGNFLSEMMPGIFDTLRSPQDFNHWKRQPFKLVWIQLLEYFIRTLDRQPDLIANNRQTLHHMVQALALQFDLTEEGDEMFVDGTLNLAMLYRYCTVMGVVNARKMLDVAYHTLIGAIEEEPKMIKNTDDPDRMACIISGQAETFTPTQTTLSKYEGTGADLILNNTTITLVPKETSGELYDYVPEHLELWNGLQVKLDERPDPIGKKNRHVIKPYKTLWKDVERSLFLPDETKQAKYDSSRLAVDDEVGIIVTKQLAGETPTFECVIVDSAPGDIGRRGVIRMADMVGYATTTVGLFSFENEGKPLVFSAVVTRVNEDGTFRFKAKEIIDDLCANYRYNHIPYVSRLYCIVTAGSTVSPAFYAVSQQGMSMCVHYEDGDSPIQMDKGTIIEVTSIEQGNGGFINAVFSRIAPEVHFTLAEAFHSLMLLLSKGEVYELKDEDEEEQADVLEKPRVKELIALIEQVASLEHDYIKTYNYLGFCKILSLVAEEQDMACYYENKMGLLELLHEFDMNDSLSGELIEKFRQDYGDFLVQHSSLANQFRKLQIVSYMGTDNHNTELCYLACDNPHSDLGQLAQMIVSYNFMQQTSMAPQAERVLEHVKEMLQLQKKENPKKDYGPETYTKEFKTSMVCPPDTMRPDIERQTRKVMEEICAFLNADGGVLYIGVDDKTHLERGIDEDLAHPFFGGSRDKYENYVHNQINRMLTPGEVADHYISTEFDSEAQMPVFVIRIAPSPEPIHIDGVFYERRGTSSRQVSEEYRPLFILNRKRRTDEDTLEEVQQIIAQAEAKRQAAHETSSAVPPAATAPRPLAFSTGTDTIRTSRTRSYRHRNDGMQADDLYYHIGFTENNSFYWANSLLTEKLTLSLYEEEYEEGCLVVVYETGEIARIRMADIFQRSEWEQQPIHNKSKIAFISPAMPDDVLSIFFHSRNGDYYRFISVNTLDAGSFNTPSLRSFYTGQVDEIKDCELVRLNERSPYKNFLDIDFAKVGADARKTEGKRAARLIAAQRGED